MTENTQRRPRVGVLLSAAVVCVCLALLAGCDGEVTRETLSGGTMGTTWSVVYEPVPGSRREALLGLIERELEAINAALSTYIPDSEISRVNRAGGERQVLSPRFAKVLDASLAISRRTGGAYDVTVGPLVDLWGFGARDTGDKLPAAAAVAAAREQVGFQRLAFDPAARALVMPAGMAIDLSSIAKGYAVDRVLAALQEQGIRNALVEIGGELRAAGERPEGGPWRLAVESPVPGHGRVLEALAVADAAVATSGDYRNFFEIDGERYSHLVDPRTGYPVKHDLVSVTVVHDNCMEADGWATALIVLGREAALATAEAQGLAVYLVSRDGDEIALDYTDEFAPFLAGAGERPGASGS